MNDERTTAANLTDDELVNAVRERMAELDDAGRRELLNKLNAAVTPYVDTRGPLERSKRVRLSGGY